MNNLRQLRKKCGMTLQFVADSLELSNGAVSMYESGSRDVPTNLLPRFAQLYGCSIDDIFADTFSLDELVPLSPLKSLSPKDEMEQQLLERFRSLSFDDKLKAINYITNLIK